MSLIIDTNCLPYVFNDETLEHYIYAPVKKAIISRRAKILIGGTTYKKEIVQMTSYLKILATLKRTRNSIIIINDQIVDAEEKRIRALIHSNDFDDPHIGALVAASGCRIVCTQDSRSIRHLKRKDIYPDNIAPPKFYTSESNSSLLISDNLNIEVHNTVKDWPSLNPPIVPINVSAEIA